MQEVIRQMETTIRTLQPAGSFGILCLAAAVLLLWQWREEEKFAGLYGLLTIGVMCNPAFVWLAAAVFPELAGYTPFLPLLPVLTVGAAGAVVLLELRQKQAERLALLAGLAILIGLAGSGYGIRTERAGGFSLQAVPVEEKQVLELVKEEAPEGLMLAADAVAEYAREYAPGLRLLYGKDMWTSGLNLGIMDVYGEELTGLHESMQDPEVCMDDITAVAAMYECDLVVVKRFESARETEGNYRLAAETEQYLIYRKEVTE